MMSFQWLITAAFLYAEIFFIFLLLLPIISPRRWKQLFNSSLIKRVQKGGNRIFLFFIISLSVLLLDAIRELYKYSEESPISEAFNFNMQQGREFRAQRNLYITGISLFLAFVVKRLIVLITKSADLMEEIDLLKNKNGSLLKESEINRQKLDENLEKINFSAPEPTAPPKYEEATQVKSRSKKDL